CDAIDLDLGVRADATRLTQVLINLLTNALKYNRPGGNVFVRVLPTADHIALSVEDTGYGIQPKNLVRIFHLFERADAAESTIGGAGIGLALAKYYVERMQGRIEVTSIVGVGSRFTVTLPRGNLGGPTTSGTLPDAATSA
ncbi:MAG: ATP-binding protein, partial [Nitrosomonadaceae bacterium]|nr:ATP-binding protein [Nitrosomonadaceae bacterium]